MVATGLWFGRGATSPEIVAINSHEILKVKEGRIGKTQKTVVVRIVTSEVDGQGPMPSWIVMTVA